MALDVKELLRTTAYRKIDMDSLLDPAHPPFLRFDPELGYVFVDFVMRDGVNDSLSVYSYEPKGGHRKMINYADRPCRINTYGDSFTQCQQVSDGETWQEVLAAHIREPVRNFGVGGWSVYQAYRRALRVEADSDLSAEYIILNIWDDDHIRNLDVARWIRTAWDQRDRPWSGGDAPWPIHGFPWSHVRFDLDKGSFVELPGYCKDEADLRKLADPDYYYEFFKDDTIVHLFTLIIGGEAPVEELEKVAEALGVRVNLRDPKKRAGEARRLHLAYGIKSTMFLLNGMRAWIEEQHKKLLVLMTYGPPAIREFVERAERFDRELIDYLESNDVKYVDCLRKTAEDYKAYNLSLDDYLKRFYIPAAGVAVFGHYCPYGNHWLAYGIKDELVDWLDPKPPAYR